MIAAKFDDFMRVSSDLLLKTRALGERIRSVTPETCPFAPCGECDFAFCSRRAEGLRQSAASGGRPQLRVVSQPWVSHAPAE